MWPDRVLNPTPLTYESGALPIALCGPAQWRLRKISQVCQTYETALPKSARPEHQSRGSHKNTSRLVSS